MSWLTDLLEQHEELESPKSFWFWSALCAVSAVVKDNIWLDKYQYKNYPNIYVMLLADSGLKKGPPVSMAKQLVKNVGNTTVISGRSSIQGILKSMEGSTTEPGGKVIKKNSSAFICSSEFSSSIVADPAAMDILTDLYDRGYNPGEWTSLLKSEKFAINNPVLTMLTATNDAHATSFFGDKDMRGGYFARTFIIAETRPATINSLMFPLKHPIDYKNSAEYLKELAKLKGEFIFPLEVRKYFDDWYRKFKKEIIDKKVKDTTGTLNRFDDSILKVSMLLALANEPSLTMTMDVMEDAIRRCEVLIGNARKATMSSGKSSTVQQKATLIQELRERDNHRITRTALNKKYWMDASAQEWDDIAESLKGAGLLTIEMEGNQVVYIMPDSVVATLNAHYSGRSIS